jgi:hypothetical protein
MSAVTTSLYKQVLVWRGGLWWYVTDRFDTLRGFEGWRAGVWCGCWSGLMGWSMLWVLLGAGKERDCGEKVAAMTDVSVCLYVWVCWLVLSSYVSFLPGVSVYLISTGCLVCCPCVVLSVSFTFSPDRWPHCLLPPTVSALRSINIYSHFMVDFHLASTLIIFLETPEYFSIVQW